MALKKIELLIEDKTVDLFGDESFPISFTIDEITDIGKKAASFSKEISLPATDNNNEVFTSLFDVTVEGGFNPISRKRAVLFVDGVAIMQGYFKLLGVNIQENEYPTYQGLLYEEQINFLAALDDFYIENLSIPLTGTTSSITAPFTNVATFTLDGLNSFSPGQYVLRNASGGEYSDTVYFTGVTFNTGSYASVTTQPGSTDYLPSGITWKTSSGAPYNLNSYEASTAHRVNLSINIQLLTIGSQGNYRVTVWRSDYTSPVSGLYTDYVVYNATHLGSAPVGGTFPNPLSTANININNLIIDLGAGDKFRIEIFNLNGASNVTVGASSTITGIVQLGSGAITTGFTPTLTTIMSNTNGVNTSDDYPIVFPLIDYSDNYSFTNYNLSTFLNVSTYGLPKILTIDVDDLRPAVFVKQVWDSIFRQSGFKYKSNFLNSDTFKKMIVAGGVGEEEISSLIYESTINTSIPLSGWKIVDKSDRNVTIGGVNLYDYDNSDPNIYSFDLTNVPLAFSQTTGAALNVYKPMKLVNSVDAYTTIIPSYRHAGSQNSTTNASPYYYGYDLSVTGSADKTPGLFPTAAKDGKYRVHAKLRFTAEVPKAGSTPQNTRSTDFSLILLKLKNGSYKYSPGASAIPTLTGTGTQWEEVKSARVTRAPFSGYTEHILEIDEKVELKKGDMIRVILVANTGSSGISQRISAQFNATPEGFLKVYRFGSVFNTKIDNAATLLPKKFKQRDFILELAKMFNLYFEADREDPKTLLIEPRDTYYEAGIIQNWERKIDYTKDFKIDILSHDYPKTQIFKYADDDDDYLSTRYSELSNNKLIFGSYIYTSQNDYNVDEETLELKFAPSYIQRLPDSNIKITKIHLPELYDTDYVKGKKVKYKVKPRIMMYKKYGAITPGYRLTLSQPTPPAILVPPTPYNLNYTVNIRTFTAPSVNMDVYGYAGHLDDPNTPSFDLNWFTDFNYLPAVTGTTQNLFNVFYKQQMIELTDQTARKVTCFVDLTPVDVANLRFNDIYYFAGEYWRLLEISDYDTSSDIKQTTKCTFIKIVRAQTNQLIDYQAFGYLGINGGTGGGLIGNTYEETE